MLVKEAKDIVRQWVVEEGSTIAGFCGAYFCGSTNWMSDDAELPPTSDVDVAIVVDHADPPGRCEKSLVYKVIVDLSFRSSSQFHTPDLMLATYFEAAHFTTRNIILDPLGRLTAIQQEVASHYAKRPWVYKRCEDVLTRIRTRLDWLKETDSFPQQVFSWLYPLSLVNHLILVADLKNPTVRQMFVASRDVLGRYDHLSFHESVLRLLGSETLTPVQAEHHLAELAEVFDVAKRCVRTSFFGAGYLQERTRPMVIDGNKEVIAGGFHREAMFWITMCSTWCQRALANDAPVEIQARFAPQYHQLMNALGIDSFADLRRRNEALQEVLPHVRKVAEDIMAHNPTIVDD